LYSEQVPRRGTVFRIHVLLFRAAVLLGLWTHVAIRINWRREKPLAGTKRRSGDFWCQTRPGWMDKEMDFQKLLTLGDLAAMLGRSPETIKKDLRRNPGAVPPRLVLPRTRLLRWRECDVAAWLAQFVQVSSPLQNADLPMVQK